MNASCNSSPANHDDSNPDIPGSRAHLCELLLRQSEEIRLWKQRAVLAEQSLKVIRAVVREGTEKMDLDSAKKAENETEKRALAYFRKRLWKDDPNVADSGIAGWVYWTALSHPREVESWILAMCHYSTWEGVNLSELLKRMPATRPEYASPD